jgi:DKNYY family
MRRSIAAVCLVAVALLPACSGNEPPNSLFDSSGYHVRGDKVYYLTAFPGAASEIAGADAVSFKAFDTAYAKDKSNAYFDGQPITGADASTFDVLNRSGFAKDRNHVRQVRRLGGLAIGPRPQAVPAHLYREEPGQKL